MASRALLALLVLAAGTAAAADIPLGTLFHTPEERSNLDRMRRGEPAPTEAPEPGRGSEVTGFVKRSDGRHTVWIDGTPVTVRGAQAQDVLDPRAVRAYSDRQDDALRIERKNTR